MNCRLKTKRDKMRTKIEIEKLYSQVDELRDKNKISIVDEDRLKCNLKREGFIDQHDFNKDLLTKEQYSKIKSFTNNDSITIRKADKGNTFVIMNKSDNKEKNRIVSARFKKMTKLKIDPSSAMKSEIMKEITYINNRTNLTLKKVSGHHEPGYISGNPKTHKKLENPHLHPIVS